MTTDLAERRRRGLELQAQLSKGRQPPKDRPLLDGAVEGAFWGSHVRELGILGVVVTVAGVVIGAVISVRRRRG